MKKLMRYEKHNVIRVAVILLCSLLLAALIERFYTNGLDFNMAAVRNQAEYVSVDLSEVVYYDYDINGSSFLTLSNDPQIVHNNIDRFISTVTITFAKPLEQTMNITVYYSSRGSGLSEDRIVLRYANAGDTRIELDINTYADSLRYDIGNLPGLGFELSGITLNESGAVSIFANYSSMSVYRIAFLFIIIFFLLVHFIVKIRVFYDLIFKYRYAIAVIIFLLLVSNKIHFSSVGIYDRFIQPGQGTEFVEPIFGTPRAIRSDEWIVATPVRVSAQYGPEPYSRFSQIVRGTETEIAKLGMNLGLSTIANPLNIAFLFGVEYGISSQWIGTLILTFMLSFELMYIVSDRSRLLAAAGACLIAFSPHFLWWSNPALISAGMGSIVCFYYFLMSESRRRKVLFASGFVVLFSQFIIFMYPAWQVPMGYLFLGLVIWILHENREKITSLNKTDWFIAGLAVIMVAGVTAVSFWESREYTAAISNTIYPGSRMTGGGNIDTGFYINRLMNGAVFAPISGERTMVQASVSEFGGFYTLFPIPFIFAAYSMVKKRVFDLLSVVLMGFSVVIGSYIFIGWPDWLAKITMMAYSMPKRATDIMLLAQVFLLIRVLSRFTERSEEKSSEEKSSRVSYGILAIAAVAGVCLTYIAMRFSRGTFVEPISFFYFLIPFFGFATVIYCILDYQRNRVVFKTACIYMVVWSCIIGVSVNPLVKGLDAIYSKPLSERVTELAEDTEEKWLCLHSGIMGSGFLIASGASTINSTNFYPNLELWEKLDRNRQYEHIYRRYAHISVELTEQDTSFELIQEEWFLLHLSYDDLETAGIKYIHSNYPLDNYWFIGFELIYDEGGSLIYRVEARGCRGERVREQGVGYEIPGEEGAERR